MKKLLPGFILSVLVISCGNNKSDQPAADEDSTGLLENRLVWQAALNDSTGLLEMKQVRSETTDSLSIQSVIESANQTNPEIVLSFVKTSNDTVYLKIADAHFLTQQMGSTGPTMYLASLIYNLTEIPNIKYVNLDFEEGDHAQPGTYNRDTFKDQ